MLARSSSCCAKGIYLATVTLTGNADVALNNTAGTATVFIRDTNGNFEHNSYNLYSECPP